ncbi:MAG TPA: hypothetical protein VHE12_11935 [bacterium]|nr:hypothetical protein [bacterium]
MWSRSKVLLLFLLPALGFAQQRPGLFSTLPAGDLAYGELTQMAQAGLLDQKDLAPVLTRYDVALLIEKAEGKRQEWVVAQADEIPPPPPSDSEPTAAPAPSAAPAASSVPAPVAPSAAPAAAPANDNMELPSPGDVITLDSAAQVNAPTTVSGAQEEAARAEAIKNLNSLEEAYQYELKYVKDKVDALQSKVDDVDSQLYDLRKRLKGIEQYPTIAVHGVGRAFGIYQELDGTGSVKGVRFTQGYLDLQPIGTISKEVRWNMILRLGSTFQPDDTPVLGLRRITMDFNPPWFSAQVGDFDQSYTPLTLWNRNNLDLRYMPEMIARFDADSKYESLLDHEPDLPLRGLRVGTDVIWPDKPVIRELQGQVFAHMIRNGFNDNGGWYLGPNIFTDWVFGARTKVKSQTWYWAGMSFQTNLEGYGLFYDQPLDTQPTGSPYDPYNPTTWARQYLVGSLRPELRIGLGNDLYVGGLFEYAHAHYQADKRQSERVFNDFALLGGPYFQFGDSRITLNYLNVGPYFYSPLAQTRQDNLDPNNPSGIPHSPELFDPALRYQYFLTQLPSGGSLYGYYDRTRDNTFPYGLGTPNRQGFGGELDIETLEKKTLKVKGAVYVVQEIGGNLVVNSGGSGFIPVDSPGGTNLLPIRDFVYVNLGPSYNLGPAMGWGGDFEIGTNVRVENTSSVLGNLTSTWILGGVRAELLPVLQVSVAYGWQGAQGTEAGYQGELLASYPYLYDNSALGLYSPVTIDASNQTLRFSTAFKVNKNSTIFFDYDWTEGDLVLGNPNQTTMSNHFGEVSYEIHF